MVVVVVAIAFAWGGLLYLQEQATSSCRWTDNWVKSLAHHGTSLFTGQLACRGWWSFNWVKPLAHLLVINGRHQKIGQSLAHLLVIDGQIIGSNHSIGSGNHWHTGLIIRSIHSYLLANIQLGQITNHWHTTCLLMDGQRTIFPSNHWPITGSMGLIVIVDILHSRTVQEIMTHTLLFDGQIPLLGSNHWAHHCWHACSLLTNIQLGQILAHLLHHHHQGIAGLLVDKSFCSPQASIPVHWPPSTSKCASDLAQLSVNQQASVSVIWPNCLYVHKQACQCTDHQQASVPVIWPNYLSINHK